MKGSVKLLVECESRNQEAAFRKLSSATRLLENNGFNVTNITGQEWTEDELNDYAREHGEE